MIKIIDGNLLDAKTNIIAHQVNCQGVFNSGVAKAIREFDESIYDDYKMLVEYAKEFNISLLGKISFVLSEKSNQLFINMFAQDKYGYDGKQYTNINAFIECIHNIRNLMEDKNLTSIAFPYKIGCVRGGADWDVIYNIIKTELSDKGYNVEFWRLDLG